MGDDFILDTPEKIAIAKMIFDNDFLSFAAYFFKVNTGETMKINWHHRFFCKILQRIYKGELGNVAINVAPGSSKCECAGNKVFTTRGWIPIQSVGVGDVVYSYNKGQMFTQNVVATQNFSKQCVKIRTKLGVQTTVSYDHPILTHTGWKYAGDLTQTDFVVQLCSKIDGKVPIPQAELDFITLLLFEGGTSQNGTGFTSADDQVVQVMQKACDTLGFTLKRKKVYDPTKDIQYSVLGGENVKKLKMLRKKYGIDRCKAINKRLPLQFFNMPLQQKYRFLGLMIATDGYITSSDGSVGLSLGSQELAKDIKLFLMTCGIPSQYRHYQNGYAGYYSVVVSPMDTIELLSNVDCLQKSCKTDICTKTRRYNLSYGYPTQFITDQISHRINTHNNLVYKRRKQGRRFHLRRNHPMCTTDFFERLADELAPQLKTYIMKDFIYDRVTSVQKIGVHQVYHLQVQSAQYDLQNFIAQGLVVHNSQLLARLFPVWCFSKNPHSRFLLTSYSDDLVEGHSVAIKDIIGSKQFQKIYPGYGFKQDSNKKAQWILQHNGSNVGEFSAFSIKGSLTGRRAGYMEQGFTGCIIIDDPIKPIDALSKAKREQCNNLIYNTLGSRKAKADTPIVMIMQRLHDEDVTGFIKRQSKGQGWTFFSIPALIDAGTFNSFPEQIKQQAYEYLKDDLQKYGQASYWEFKEPRTSLRILQQNDVSTFMAQYQQEPSPEGGILIQKDWFRNFESLPEKLTNFRITADTAISAKKTADNSVLILSAESGGNLYILDLIKGKWQMPQLIQNTLDFVQSYKTKYPNTLFKGIFIEAKASGQSLLQTLRQNTKLPVLDLQPQGDKVLRVQQCLPYMQSGRVHIPHQAMWKEQFLDQLARFSPTMSHKHDDQVDALVYAMFEVYVQARRANVQNFYYM